MVTGRIGKRGRKQYTEALFIQDRYYSISAQTWWCLTWPSMYYFNCLATVAFPLYTSYVVSPKRHVLNTHPVPELIKMMPQAAQAKYNADN